MMRINRTVVGIVAVFVLGIFLYACSGVRIRDRYDEALLTREENHYNIYARKGKAAKIHKIPSVPLKDGGGGHDSWLEYLFSWDYTEDSTFYTFSEYEGLRPLKVNSARLPESYSVMSVCWKDSAPVLRFWQRMFNSKAMELTCPLDKYNSRITASNVEYRDYEVFISLRQGTVLPWVMMDDYEIFCIKVREYRKKNEWAIRSVKQLTNNRVDDIQPVISPDDGTLAFTSVEDDVPSVFMAFPERKAGEIKFKRISENASMPFFVPGTGNIIFVKDDGGFRDFRVYLSNTGEQRAAEGEELTQVLNIMPYSSMKSGYMMINCFRRNAMANLPKGETVDFETMVLTGLRNAPEILRDYYDYESALSGTVENLYDEGPDAFMSGYYLVDNYIFVDKAEEDRVNVGDVISMENFLRLVGGMTIPIIPNIPLKLAEYARDRWYQEAVRRKFHETVNKYVPKLLAAYYDYIQWEITLDKYRRITALNRARLSKFRTQVEAGFNIGERVLFAENMTAASESEYNNAVEEFIRSQFRLSALMGLNLSKRLILKYPEPGTLLKPLEVPSFEWFQAQGQINRPEIQRADFMLKRAAAVRDMGPPSTRTDGVKVSISYGFGIEKWSEAMDDFLMLGMSHVTPLRLPILGRSYYDRWTNKIESWRNEKYRVQAEVKTDIHEAYKDLDVLTLAMLTKRKRLDFFRERVRISRIYEKLGKLEYQLSLPESVLVNQLSDTTANLIESLENEIRVTHMKCEFFRRMAELYASAGVSLKLLSRLNTKNQASEKVSPEEFVNGIFLWRSLDVVTDKVKRKKFLDFCSAKAINVVNCFVSRTKGKEFYLEKYDAEFRYFISLCTERGIKVRAMMGSKEWIKPYYRKEIASLLDMYEKFNKQCATYGLKGFSGIELDVEPHAFNQWYNEKARPGLVSEYLSMLEYVSQIAGRENISADVPYTYNGIYAGKDGEDLLKALSGYVGGITLMAYLNREKLILKKILPIMERKDLNIKISVAFETAPIKEKYISFNAKPLRELFRVRGECGARLDKYEMFNGFIIHDYEHYRKMDNSPGEN